MKKLKTWGVLLVPVLGILTAFAFTKPCGDCRQVAQYYFVRYTSVGSCLLVVGKPAGTIGVDYVCDQSLTDDICTYYYANTPCGFQLVYCQLGLFINSDDLRRRKEEAAKKRK